MYEWNKLTNIKLRELDNIPEIITHHPEEVGNYPRRGHGFESLIKKWAQEVPREVPRSGKPPNLALAPRKGCEAVRSLQKGPRRGHGCEPYIKNGRERTRTSEPHGCEPCALTS